MVCTVSDSSPNKQRGDFLLKWRDKENCPFFPEKNSVKTYQGLQVSEIIPTGFYGE